MKKDVYEYWAQLKSDLNEMEDVLNDMAKESMTSMIDPESLEQTKRLVGEMKQNLARVDWIIFLLNKPGKFRAFIDNILIKLKLKKDPNILLNLKESPEAVHKENKMIIKNVKSTYKK